MEADKAKPIARAALSVDEFCQSVGIGRSKAYEEIGAGRLKAVKIGRRTLIPVVEIDLWLARSGKAAAANMDDLRII
jgi:excisionase family DNA binding protein